MLLAPVQLFKVKFVVLLYPPLNPIALYKSEAPFVIVLTADVLEQAPCETVIE